jgi:hypothetical protein
VAGFAFDADGSSVRFDDGADETETESEAGRGAALFRAVKPFPDARLIFLGNSGAVILN